MKKFTYLLLGCALMAYSCSKPTDYLQQCWEKQGLALHQKNIRFTFKEKMHMLHHSMTPWLKSPYEINGRIELNSATFVKTDSIDFRGRNFNSITQFVGDTLTYLDYGADSASDVTEELILEHMKHNPGYIPFQLLQYYIHHPREVTFTENDSFAIYTLNLYESVSNIYIRKQDQLIDQITFLTHHKLYGDVQTIYSYSDYQTIENIAIAQHIEISRINGQIQDHVTLDEIQFTSGITPPLSLPLKYKIQKTESIADEATITHYNDRIHFIDLKDADNRTLVVEFDHFLCLAKAPLNSENGELIISKAQEIAPNKPIKYFIVGHHHPHSIGGIRPFVNTGAEIICTSENVDYLQFIIDAPRTLHPDPLQQSQKTGQYRIVEDSIHISDGSYEIQIFKIGEISAHTSDFMVYYFPQEHLLFQDDLTWMAKDQPIRKAGKRQEGLYQAIVDRQLEVDTIFQSWPIVGHNVKSIIPFEELEYSVRLTE